MVQEAFQELNIEAINRAIEILRKVPEDQFAMEAWVQDDTDCGTVCCVAGWVAQDKWFQEQGFKLRRDKMNRCTGVWYRPKGGFVSFNFNACKKFFGLTDDQTEAIFFDEQKHTSLISKIYQLKRLVKTYEDGMIR